MDLSFRYFGRLAAWGGAVLLLPVIGGGLSSPGELLGVHVTLALAVAAFPAGAALWKDVFPEDRFSPAGFGRVLALGAIASALYFVLMGYVGPALSTDGVLAMNNPTLRAAAQEAARAAEAVVPATPDAWFEANRLAHFYVRRTDGALLPLLATLLGTLSGFWASRTQSVPWQRVQLWAMGVFLLMTTYLAGENGYELVILKAAGSVPFVGDFVLIVPGALLIGMGWAALSVTWWGAERA